MLTRLLLPLDLNSFELCVISISFHIKSKSSILSVLLCWSALSYKYVREVVVVS